MAKKEGDAMHSDTQATAANAEVHTHTHTQRQWRKGSEDESLHKKKGKADAGQWLRSFCFDTLGRFGLGAETYHSSSLRVPSPLWIGAAASAEAATPRTRIADFMMIQLERESEEEREEVV